MKLNGFLALGIVLIMLGGIATLDITGPYFNGGPNGGSGDTEQHLGNLTVMGYYNAEPVSFEGWYEYDETLYVSEHRTVSAEGYTWASLSVGSYGVHGIYNDIVAEKSALVEENQTTIVQLNFGGAEPPPPSTPSYTPPSTGPSKQIDVTLIFMVTGGLAVVYGFVKQKKVKT